jgi:glycosyltransferase involved in cell wall biosynthesis
VDDSERVYYYSLAEAFVYPSFFEGFGFPPLEAMACGTPVVTSNNSSLPEIAGDAAILVDPYSVSDIAGAMHSVISDKKLREVLVRKGLERAGQFSWERCARQTLDILRR